MQTITERSQLSDAANSSIRAVGIIRIFDNFSAMEVCMLLTETGLHILVCGRQGTDRSQRVRELHVCLYSLE